MRAQQHEFSNRMHTVAGLIELGDHDAAVRYALDVSGATAGLTEAIRERVGKEAHLTIDANQSYTPKDAITAINRIIAANKIARIIQRSQRVRPSNHNLRRIPNNQRVRR